MNSQQPRHVEHQQTDKGYVPVYTTAVVAQPWADYSATDHDVWRQLYERQRALLVGRASDEFLVAQDAMGMTPDAIPKFDDLNEVLRAATGWELVGVEGLLPELTFFEHLANRRFPAGNFMRPPKQMDYLEEPDVFHDVFGHVPLLAQPAVADFMAELGNLGLKALEIGEVERIARLYWYTIEVGLAREDGRTKIYGAGIASSFGETHYSLESPRPHRLKFDLKRVLRTRYRPDDFQKSYFVIDRFEDVLNILRENDFPALCAELEGLSDIDPKSANESELLAA